MADSKTGGRVGRPPKAGQVQRPYTMQLPEAIVARIDQAAERLGTSRQALVAQACWDWLAQHGEER